MYDFKLFFFKLSGLIFGEFGSRMRPRGGPNGGWIEDQTHLGGGSDLEAYTRSPRWRFCEPTRTDELDEVAEVAFVRAGSHRRAIGGR